MPISLGKLSANKQFFDDFLTAVNLEQTTQIISDVSFITDHRVQELCESRGGRPGLPVLMSLMVSVDVKQH